MYTHQFKKNVLAETISKSLKNLLNYTPPSLFPVSMSLLFFLSLAHTLWRYENTRFATPLITVGERRGEKMRHYQTQREIVGARHIMKRHISKKGYIHFFISAISMSFIFLVHKLIITSWVLTFKTTPFNFKYYLSVRINAIIKSSHILVVIFDFLRLMKNL